MTVISAELSPAAAPLGSGSSQAQEANGDTGKVGDETTAAESRETEQS